VKIFSDRVVRQSLS